MLIYLNHRSNIYLTNTQMTPSCSAEYDMGGIYSYTVICTHIIINKNHNIYVGMIPWTNSNLYGLVSFLLHELKWITGGSGGGAVDDIDVVVV